MKIISLDDIKNCFNFNKMLSEIENSFVQYSNSNVLSAPISQFKFENIAADIHIKSGMIKEDKYYFVKIASGFYDNWKSSISNSQGVIVVINAKTGRPEIILDDQGYLTDIRTALAGIVCAKYLAPDSISEVGIFGYGIQSYLQAKFLKIQFPNLKNLFLYGRSIDKMEKLINKYKELGYTVHLSNHVEYVANNCKLLVTATPSTIPYLFGDCIKAGTHITAIGADDIHKQELDISVFKKANHIFVDSIEQSNKLSGCFHALREDGLYKNNIYEIGNFVSNLNSFKRDQNDITISFLTGLAAQDIAISKFILKNIYDNVL